MYFLSLLWQLVIRNLVVELTMCNELQNTQSDAGERMTWKIVGKRLINITQGSYKLEVGWKKVKNRISIKKLKF